MKVDYCLIVKVNGRLDTNTSPQLDTALTKILSTDKITDICFEFSELEYISSSGLRILLAAHKKTSSSGGKAYIENANEVVKNILSITGFDTLFEVNSGQTA